MTIATEDDLFLDSSGHFKGNITAKNVHISGKVDGDMISRNTIRMLSTAKVYGDLFTKGLIIEEGAVKIFELIESKSEAIENEKLDYYNLSLITTVDADTWLGERDEATDGIEGRTVKGEIRKGKKGITFPLHFYGELGWVTLKA